MLLKAWYFKAFIYINIHVIRNVKLKYTTCTIVAVSVRSYMTATPEAPVCISTCGVQGTVVGVFVTFVDILKKILICKMNTFTYFKPRQQLLKETREYLHDHHLSFRLKYPKQFFLLFYLRIFISMHMQKDYLLAFLHFNVICI